METYGDIIESGQAQAELSFECGRSSSTSVNNECTRSVFQYITYLHGISKLLETILL
jgi:hypothetical protein